MSDNKKCFCMCHHPGNGYASIMHFAPCCDGENVATMAEHIAAKDEEIARLKRALEMGH